MDNHRFEWNGTVFEIRFERTDEAWIAHIQRVHDAAGHHVAFPHGAGYAPDDVRASLIAGCEAAVSKLPWPAPTRH